MMNQIEPFLDEYESWLRRPESCTDPDKIKWFERIFDATKRKLHVSAPSNDTSYHV